MTSFTKLFTKGLQRRRWISCTSRGVSTVKLENDHKAQGVIATQEEVTQFDQVFPEIIEDLTNNKTYPTLGEVTKRFARSLKYNVPHGKKNRGLTVVSSYKHLEKPENLTSENIKLANILGWTVELLQAFFLVIDDLTDGSETRRGQLCWYKNEDIGSGAVNDGIILENSVYILLKKYFSRHRSYVDFMELFHETTMNTTMGQVLDGNTLGVNNISMARYELIVNYKTSLYSFHLPVALAMYLSDYTNPTVHHQVKEILLEIGKFFQIQDDFLDCFGDPKVTGKIGTDIETAKCTWLAVTAMQIASANQKQIMEENYGKYDPQNVQKVRDLYLELGIPKLYGEYEENSYNQIQSSVLNLSEKKLHGLLNNLVGTIYKRDC